MAPRRSWICPPQFLGWALYLGSLICFCFVWAKPSPAEGFNFCCRKAALLMLHLPLLPQSLEKPS